MLLLLLSTVTAAHAKYAKTVSGNSRGVFRAPPLQSGEISPLLWQDSAKQVTQFACRIGLPSNLTSVVREYCDRTRLTDLFWSLEHSNPIPPGNHRLVKLDEQQWFADRPAQEWSSNMQYVSPADEAAHEDFLKVLDDGGMDVVFDSIGSYYNLNGLVVQGLGFIAVSHCNGFFFHQDMPGTGGRFFNLIFPLILEEDASPELMVVDDGEEKRVGAAKYEYGVGLMLGDGATHATAPCDYRGTSGMRVVVTVYMADINESNVDVIAADEAQIFPVPNNAGWLYSQKGRHWERKKRLSGDRSRKAYSAVDAWNSCTELALEGKCQTDVWYTRMHCLKSCKVFL